MSIVTPTYFSLDQIHFLKLILQLVSCSNSLILTVLFNSFVQEEMMHTELICSIARKSASQINYNNLLLVRLRMSRIKNEWKILKQRRISKREMPIENENNRWNTSPTCENRTVSRVRMPN